jgi:hypothetical protein
MIDPIARDENNAGIHCNKDLLFATHPPAPQKNNAKIMIQESWHEVQRNGSNAWGESRNWLTRGNADQRVQVFR